MHSPRQLLTHEGQVDNDWAERWISGVKWVAANAAFRVFPRLTSAALEIRASDLRAPSIPHLFSTDLREIQPALNEDLLDLFGKSEQTVANRFSFLERPEALEAGFDWEAPGRRAWRQELHGFDYGLDLALTYRISREDRYARHLRYLIAHWIARNPPARGTGWEVLSLSRRIRNWILAADLARDDWSSQPAFFDIVARSLALQCAFLLDHAPSTAFPVENLKVAQGLLLGARFFSEHGEERLHLKGRTILADALENRLAEDGSYSRGRPIDQLRLAEALLEYLLFHTGSGCRDETPEKLKAREILNALECMLLPDGTLPRLGPGASSAAEALSNLFGVAAVIFQEPAWKSLAGQFGIIPYLLLGEDGQRRFKDLPEVAWTCTSVQQPRGGLYRLSGDKASALVINARLPRFRDDHQDFLSYELGILGHRVIVDSGASVPEPGKRDESLASPQAHNLLLVDDRAPRFQSTLALQQRPGRCIPGPNSAGLVLPDPGYEFMGIAHTRAYFCLGGSAWVVLDRVEGSGTHRIQNLIHLYPTLDAEVSEGRVTLRSRAITCTLILFAKPQPEVTVRRGPDRFLPGLYAPEPGVMFDASVLALEVREAALPWLGGYLVVPGSEGAFKAGVVDAERGVIGFDLAGKSYTLDLRAKAA